MRLPTGPGSATRAVALSALSVLSFATFAATPRSPFQPVLPQAPRGPFVWFAKLIHADALSGNLFVAAGVLVTAFSVVSFLLLLREAWRGNVSLRTVLVLVIAFHAVVLMLPLLFSRDVYSYAFYGRIVGIYHGNPYVQTPLNYAGDPLWSLLGPKWVDTPAVYGPLFSTVSGRIATVFASPFSQADAYRVVAICASLATVAVTVWTCRALWPSRSAFAAAAFGANPVILFHSVASGHNDLLVALSVACALAFLVRGRELPAVASLTLGALIKASGVLPLALLIVWCVARRPARRRRRTLATHAGLAAGLALLISAPYLQAHDPTLGMLQLAGHEGWLAPSLFLRRIVDALSLHALGGVIRIAFLAALVVAFVSLAREVARRAESLSPRGNGAAWGWSLTIFMLLGPVLLPWYVVWAMPMAWLLPRAARMALIGTGVGLAMAQWSTFPELYPTAFRVNLWIGHWIVTPVILALLVWVLLDLRRRIRGDLPLECEEDLALPALGVHGLHADPGEPPVPART